MKKKSKTILITGGSGFIGSHLVDIFINNQYKVRVLDIKTPHRSDLDYIRGSVVDRNLIEKIMVGVDYVYHLAAVSNIDHVKNNPVETVELNIMATIYLLEEAKKNNVKRFLMASSVFVYEMSGHLYTSSKKYSEILCSNYFSLYNIPYTILRFATVYGPRSRGVDVISKFIDNYFKEESLVINGNGNQKRNFIFVEDLANASLLAVSSSKAINKILTIASEKSISINELANVIKHVFNKNIKIKYNDEGPRKDDYKGFVENIEPTFKLLQWRPKIELQEGIRKYVEWYNNYA